MITTEQWRIAIGSFQHHGYAKLLNMPSLVNSYSLIAALFKLFFVLFLLCDSIIISILIILMKLMIDGDVESNPGPTYNIVKLVKASFH